MIVLNVTAIIEESLKDEFLEYNIHTHIPLVLSTGKFKSHHFYQLTDPVNEGLTYVMQFFAETKNDLEDFKNLYLEKINKEFNTRFGNKALTFRSVLESIDNL